MNEVIDSHKMNAENTGEEGYFPFCYYAKMSGNQINTGIRLGKKRFDLELLVKSDDSNVVPFPGSDTIKQFYKLPFTIEYDPEKTKLIVTTKHGKKKKFIVAQENG